VEEKAVSLISAALQAAEVPALRAA